MTLLVSSSFYIYSLFSPVSLLLFLHELPALPPALHVFYLLFRVPYEVLLHTSVLFPRLAALVCLIYVLVCGYPDVAPVLHTL